MVGYDGRDWSEDTAVAFRPGAGGLNKSGKKKGRRKKGKKKKQKGELSKNRSSASLPRQVKDKRSRERNPRILLFSYPKTSLFKSLRSCSLRIPCNAAPICSDSSSNDGEIGRLMVFDQLG